MSSVLSALAKAFSQLFDPAVLRVLAKTVGVTVLVFVALGLGFSWLIEWGLESALLPFLPDDYEGPAAAFLAFVLAIVLFWLLFRVVALAVLQLFADEIVAAVEARHYALAHATAKPLPLHKDIANSLRGAGRAMLFNLLALPFAIVLLVTGIGSAVVFLLVNAVLLGRELTDMAWLRHCDGDVGGNPVPKGHRLILGGAIAGMMIVPFLNLIAPVLGAAAGTHLAHSHMLRSHSRSAAKGGPDKGESDA